MATNIHLDHKEYTKEFYKLNNRVGRIEDDANKVVRYINVLRIDIQDEIGLLSLKIVEDAYQASLKVEEKPVRKQNQRIQGMGHARGRRQQIRRGRIQSTKREDEGSSSSQSPRRCYSRGRRSFFRGRG